MKASWLKNCTYIGKWKQLPHWFWYILTLNSHISSKQHLQIDFLKHKFKTLTKYHRAHTTKCFFPRWPRIVFPVLPFASPTWRVRNWPENINWQLSPEKWWSEGYFKTTDWGFNIPLSPEEIVAFRLLSFRNGPFLGDMTRQFSGVVSYQFNLWWISGSWMANINRSHNITNPNNALW